MNELVKKSFKATPIIVRVVYRVFCIIYRPNKNLKKNAFGVASDVYSIYGVLSDSKNNQINENDIEEILSIHPLQLLFLQILMKSLQIKRSVLIQIPPLF